MAIITQDWLTVTPTSGEVGTTSVSLSAQTAGVDRLYREAKITFRAGNLTKEVYVTQHSGAGDDYQHLAAPSVVTEISGGNIVATFTLPQGNPEGTVYYAKITKGSKEDYTESSTGFSAITQAPNNKLSYKINGEGDYYVNMAAVYGTMITPKSTKVTFQKIKLSAPTGLKAEEAKKNFNFIRFDWNMYTTTNGHTQGEVSAFTGFQYWYFKIEQASDRNLQNPPTGRAGLVSGTTTNPYFELQGIENNSEYRFFLKAEANSNIYTDSDFVAINASPKPSPYYQITSDVQELPINNIANITLTPVNSAWNYWPKFYLTTGCRVELKDSNGNEITVNSDGTFFNNQPPTTPTVIKLTNINSKKQTYPVNISAITYGQSSQTSVIARNSLELTMKENPNGISTDIVIAFKLDTDNTEYSSHTENISYEAKTTKITIVNKGGRDISFPEDALIANINYGGVDAFITMQDVGDSLSKNLVIARNAGQSTRSATVSFYIANSTDETEIFSNTVTFTINQAAYSSGFQVTPSGITIGRAITNYVVNGNKITIRSDSDFMLSGPEGTYWKVTDGSGGNLNYEMKVSEGVYTPVTKESGYTFSSSNLVEIRVYREQTLTNGNANIEESQQSVNFYSGNTLGTFSSIAETRTVHTYPIKVINSQIVRYVVIGGTTLDNGSQTHTEWNEITVPRGYEEIGSDAYEEATQLNINLLSNTRYYLKAVSGNSEQFVYFDSEHSLTAETSSNVKDPGVTSGLTLYMKDADLSSTNALTNEIHVYRYWNGEYNQDYSEKFVEYEPGVSNLFWESYLKITKPAMAVNNYFKVTILQTQPNGNDSDFTDNGFVDLTTSAFSNLPEAKRSFNSSSGIRYFRVYSTDGWRMDYDLVDNKNPFSIASSYGDVWSNIEENQDSVSGKYQIIASSGNTYFIINDISTLSQIVFTFQFYPNNLSLVNQGQGSIKFKDTNWSEYGTVESFTITSFGIVSGIPQGSDLESEDFVIDTSDSASTAYEKLNNSVLNGPTGRFITDGGIFNGQLNSGYSMHIQGVANISNGVSGSNVLVKVVGEYQNTARDWLFPGNETDLDSYPGLFGTVNNNNIAEFKNLDIFSCFIINDSGDALNTSTWGKNTKLKFVYNTGDSSKTKVELSSTMKSINKIYVDKGDGQQPKELINTGLKFIDLFEAWYGEESSGE